MGSGESEKESQAKSDSEKEIVRHFRFLAAWSIFEAISAKYRP
jgi:hypothetical protein